MTPYRFAAATLSLWLLTAVRADEGCNIDFRFTKCEDEKEEVVVLGHNSPDTDAVSAAIIRAWELRTGPEDVCASPYVNRDQINRETEFVLDYFNIDVPPTISELVLDGSTEPKTFRRFAVVDTNSITELPDDANGASEMYLHSVVDHHRMTGTLQSDKPVVFDVRVLTSTGSILYQRSLVEGRPIPGVDCPINIAGLMLATILSDSLVFRSSTTTQMDKDAADALAPLAGIDSYMDFGVNMLAAKSNITGKTAADLVVLDSKNQKADNKEGGKYMIRVSVFETVHANQVLEMAEEIATACDLQLEKDQVEASNAVVVLFFIINILDNEAIFIPCSNQYGTDLVLNGDFQMADEADRQLTNPPKYVNPVELVERNGTQVIVLPTVLSRKNQIMPALLQSVETTPYTGLTPDEVECMEYMNGKVECNGHVDAEADTNVIETKESNSDDIESKEVNSNSHDVLASDVNSNDASSSESSSHDTAESSHDNMDTESNSIDESYDSSSHDNSHDNTDTCSTIFDLACNTDGFDTLCGLLTSFDFEATLSGGSWTVFAPTDEAFTKLDDALDGGIASVSDDLLLKILQFHVVKDQVLYSDDLPCESGNNLVMALNGKESRTICKNDVPYGQKGGGNDDVVDFVTVDIDACNGVVHAIEGVLLFNLASYI